MTPLAGKVLCPDESVSIEEIRVAVLQGLIVAD